MKKIQEIIDSFLSRHPKIDAIVKSPRGAALIQFVKFGIVGVSNTLISYVVYSLMYFIGEHTFIDPANDLATSIWMQSSSVVAFVVSVLNSFYWNNKYVFGEEGGKRSRAKTLIKTFIAYGSTGLLLNAVLLELWKSYFGISPYIAQIINYLITIPLNFLLNKFWAYRNKSK